MCLLLRDSAITVARVKFMVARTPDSHAPMAARVEAAERHRIQRVATAWNLLSERSNGVCSAHVLPNNKPADEDSENNRCRQGR